MTPPPPGPRPARLQGLVTAAAAWICLAAVLFWIVRRILPALSIPWWFNTDEVVFYTEVIRQLRLDPSQTFFDIPGTPYMTLASAATALWWFAARIAGLTAIANPSDFAFANIQGVFIMMRVITLCLYAASVALAFDIFRRFAGALAAAIAAVLLATLPIHVYYSHFVRTESLGLFLSLAAVWIVLCSRWSNSRRAYLVAGLLAGVATAARFHFALVGFPVILAVFLLRDLHTFPLKCDYSSYRRIYSIAAGAGVFFAVGGAVTVAFRLGWIGASPVTHTMMLTSPSGPAISAAAKSFVANLWLVLGAVGTSLALFTRIKYCRRFASPLLNSYTLLLAIGFAAGFLVSHPAFLWRGEHQLRSIQFYADWTDPKLQSLGPFRSWLNVTYFYFTAALPERWLQVSFAIGVAVILWCRRPVQLAFLCGAALCFVAHPVSMKLWPHHVIPWLPFLCFVAASPFGLLVGPLLNRLRHPAVAAFIVVLCVSALLLACRNRFGHLEDYWVTSRARTDQITQMNEWLARHVPGDAYLLVSYFALNGDGFLKHIENAGVSVPAFVKKHRNLKIWWLERSAVDGQAGFICMSRADIAFFYEDFERRNAGSIYNPFQDSAFQLIAQFGGGFYQLQVFRFDFRSRKKAGLSATKGQLLCSVTQRILLVKS